LTEDRLRYYRPYEKQLAFHKAGASHRERLLMAGNQLGKTLAGGFEVAMHATGRYPDWWQGKRFDKPTVGWACGVTGEVVRDTVQKVLVGRTGQEGSGAVPKDAIAELVSARGIPDLLDTIRVNHVSGGVSIIGLKTYASGREKFQGETLDYVWLDEEPPSDIFTEALTRTNVGAGPVFVTFTPLQGVSTVVKRFLHEKSPDRYKVVMTIDMWSTIAPMRSKKSLRVTRHTRPRLASKEFQYLAQVECFPSRKSRLQSRIANSPTIGRASAAWTSAGTIRSRLSSWCGTVTQTLFTFLRRIG
jgi:phage terminase large subunit-like protein